MYEKLKECPVCKSDNIKNHKIVNDSSVSNESFVIMICDNCNFQFTNPRPNAANIGKYYESEDYISHTNQGNSPINLIYKIVRRYSTSKKVQLIKSISKLEKGKLLDYGVGTGYFLSKVKKAGWKVAGIEPNSQAREIANKITDNSVIKDINSIEGKYDIITLWHVLEHIHDLNETFSHLKSLLKEKGRLIIAIPNINSLDNKIYKEDWAAYDVPRHLYHFNQETMKTFVLKHGMKIKRIHPMKFDSFYISMLSEKHRTGSNNYLKSFINGFKSNSYANKNKNNYSSLIYELKK